MKHRVGKHIAVIAAAVLLCGTVRLPQRTARAAETIVYPEITGLPYGGDPVKGVDVSSVISLENSGVVFRDRKGDVQDIFVTLAEAGVNTVRVRVWNDPYNAQTRANYGGGICDVDCAVQIAERCAKAGLGLLVDFHYSDFWADPGKQNAPKAWEQYSVQQKADAIYRFTSDALRRIGGTGAKIAMVQVGNETTTGMCGVMLADYNWSDAGWRDLASLFNAGAKAVREFSKETRVVLHFTNPEKSDNMKYLAKMLRQTQVDYDIFATSYYPYWHGTMQNLTAVLSDIALQYGKQVMVAETSWARTFEDGDRFPNTIGGEDKLGDYVRYEIGTAGQTAFLHDLFRAVAAVPDGKGIGVCYWEPAWLPVGSDYNSNLRLWEQYGSGWANSAAGEFDKSAAQYYGGSAVDNESLFAHDGTPLDSLYAFAAVRGSGANVKAEGELLENGGFEADHGWSNRPAGWTLYPTAGDHFDVRAEDAHSGGYALHWYSETPFEGSRAETSVTAKEDGVYRFSVQLQASETTQYALTIAGENGKETSVTGSGFGWDQWQTLGIDLPVHAGEKITATIAVSGDAGSFGSVDDCSLCRIAELPADTTASPATTTTTTTTTSPAPQHGLSGDVNCDGEITLEDAVLLAKVVGQVQGISLTAEGRANADCDGSAGIGNGDLVYLLCVLSGAADA